MANFRRFVRTYPQVFALLMICLILGLGTFLAVVFGLITAGKNASPTGEPSGVVAPWAHAAVHTPPWAHAAVHSPPGAPPRSRAEIRRSGVV